MNFELPKWGLLLAVFLLFALASGFCAGKEPGAPYYRFWRGFKKNNLAWQEFHQALVTDFMPATVKTHGGEGLMSYLVVLPVGSESWNLPDEIALVAYASQDVYKTITSTPHGKAYQEKHGEIFANKWNSPAATIEIPGQSRLSHSLVPIDFTGVSPEGFRKEAAYDLLAQPVDWQSGYSVFSLGIRSRSLRPDFFWDALYKQLTSEKEAFSPMGLRGYVVISAPNYVIAFQNWESQDAMTKATQGPTGKVLQQKAASIMPTIFQKEFRDFDGNVQPGECVNVKFARPSERIFPVQKGP
jgi:quinol monooxygenase YgiN